MVDVTEKAVKARVARAQSTIQLPASLSQYLQGEELNLKKGPVFQTAIIAGTMAVKKTHEMIPFCHQIPVESCKFRISVDPGLRVTIECTVKTTFKTGVEMEALHGAMTAALTIYDMCKAVSHEMVIGETKLLSKTGGKRTILDRPLKGLVLTGGRSVRMNRDKALIPYRGMPHAEYIYRVLSEFCDEVFVSAREGQWSGTPLDSLPVLPDAKDLKSPIAGILSAFERDPDANWLVVACDLVNFNEKIVEALIANHDPEKSATAFRNSDKEFPEPLCTLYTPRAREVFESAASAGVTCPVKVLRNQSVTLLLQNEELDLSNINTVQEYEQVMNENY